VGLSFRERITSRWLRVINVISGVVIGAFALASILLAVRG
jgi:hypothetical protein